MIFVAFAGMPAHAESPNAGPNTDGLLSSRALSAKDKTDILRAEQYLNRITTIESRFLQVTSRGQFAEGTLHIARPGRMRIEYDAPNPILIVANNDTLTYVDRDFDQANYYPLSETPADVLLRKNIRLISDEFTITDIEREAATLRITFAKSADPLRGRVTLVFSEAPFQLKKWDVIDAQGLLTAVALQGPRFGLALDDALFHHEVSVINNPR